MDTESGSSPFLPHIPGPRTPRLSRPPPPPRHGPAPPRPAGLAPPRTGLAASAVAVGTAYVTAPGAADWRELFEKAAEGGSGSRTWSR